MHAAVAADALSRTVEVVEAETDAAAASAEGAKQGRNGSNRVVAAADVMHGSGRAGTPEFKFYFIF